MAQFRQGYSQTNVDGQQLTINYHSQTDTEQPGFSRDAIAEFEVVANRFDATQGRSQGMVVNAVTKSGTNTFAGSFGGYFQARQVQREGLHRRSRAALLEPAGEHDVRRADPTRSRSLLRRRTDTSGSRRPTPSTSPYPSFNIDQEFPTKVAQGSRAGWTISSRRRRDSSARVSYFNNIFYAGGGATQHPSAGGTRKRETPQYNGTLTQVLSSRAVNEIRAGGTNYERLDQPSVRWKGGPFPYHPVGARELRRSSSCRAIPSAPTRSTSSSTPRPFATTTRRHMTGADATT